VLALILLSTTTTFAQSSATQSYVSIDGSVTFEFPDGWIADETFSGFMRVGTSQAVLDADNAGGVVPALNTGEALLIILTPEIIESILEIDPAISPFDMVAEFTNPLETINEYQANGRAIAYALADLEQDEGWTFGIEIGGGMTAIMVAAHATGEPDVHFDTFLAIAESIHHPDFPLTEEPSVVSTGSLGTFTTSDDSLSLATPDGWDAGQVSDSVFISYPDDNGGVRMLVLPPNRVAQEVDVSTATPFDIADNFTYILAGREGASVESGRAAFLDIGQSIRVNSTYADRDEVLLAVELEEGSFAVIIASMPAGMRDTYEPVIFDIVETFSTSDDVTTLPNNDTALTQEYVDSTLEFEFMLPDGWVWHSFSEDTDVEDIGIMIFTDSQETYDAIFIDNEAALANEAVMLLVFNPDIIFLLITLDSGFDATPNEVFDTFLELSGTEYDFLDETITYEGNRNTVLYTTFESNGLHGVYGLVVLGDNEYAGINVLAESTNPDDYMPTILAIADTMVFSR
jgi:hypothetical protein